MNAWQMATFLLIGLIVGYGVSILVSSNAASNGLIAAPSINAPEQAIVDQPTGPIEVSADDDAVLGNPDALVTIIEFSDFQCPYCRRSYNELLPPLKENYIDKGLVSFIYRDYPLDFHADAKKAAEATECAEEQGKFWEMHDAIFEGQNALGNGTVAIPYDNLKQYANDLGLDTDQFNQCLDSGKYEDEVTNDLRDGIKYNVSGTPTFFVNGQRIVGAQPYSVVSSVIDSLLDQ